MSEWKQPVSLEDLGTLCSKVRFRPFSLVQITPLCGQKLRKRTIDSWLCHLAKSWKSAVPLYKMLVQPRIRPFPRSRTLTKIGGTPCSYELTDYWPQIFLKNTQCFRIATASAFCLKLRQWSVGNSRSPSPSVWNLSVAASSNIFLVLVTFFQ